MKKWKQRIALFLSVILSITSVFTWNSTIRVHAEEAVIKSSADGFEYRYQSDTHEYLCTSDKTQVYDDYEEIKLQTIFLLDAECPILVSI